MSKKDWYILISALILSCLFDQFTKWMALNLFSDSAVTLGPFGFKVYQQSFLMDNLDLLQYITTTTSGVFGIFFLFLFFIMNLVWTDRLFYLRMSLTLLASGFLCDSIDKIFTKGSVDWIMVFGKYISLNDIYALVGLVFTIYFLIKEYSVIFYKNNIRKKLIIQKDQYFFCGYILLIFLIFAAGFGIFFVTTFTIITDHAVSFSPGNRTNLMLVFSMLFLLLSFCFLTIMCVFTIYLSNKIYGPVYAFKKYITDVLLSGEKDRPLYLRKGDHFRDLPELAKQLGDKYKKTEN